MSVKVKTMRFFIFMIWKVRRRGLKDSFIIEDDSYSKRSKSVKKKDKWKHVKLVIITCTLLPFSPFCCCKVKIVSNVIINLLIRWRNNMVAPCWNVWYNILLLAFVHAFFHTLYWWWANLLIDIERTIVRYMFYIETCDHILSNTST